MSAQETRSVPAGARRTRPRLALVMVGLPARGKTYMARRLVRYLSWLSLRTEVFNVGNYRRESVGSRQGHDFFDPDNVEASSIRANLAERALDDLCTWFDQGGEVGIYDATNTTRARRDLVRGQLTNKGVQTVFVESICNDARVIAANIRETKLRMPDYAGVDPDVAVADFERRISHYEKVYQPVDESEGSFVTVYDVGRKIVAHEISGFWPARIVYFLANLHPLPRPIFLTRHGQSQYNEAGQIGGDSELTAAGRDFAGRLASFAQQEFATELRAIEQQPVSAHANKAARSVEVWTSTLRRTQQTAGPLLEGRELQTNWSELRSLDEIDAGACDGMTYAEIQAELPREWQAREDDKFGYRYPQGESYRDVIRRLEPVIVELERERAPVILISHQAVLRALYAYFMGLRPEECPRLEIPLHTVIKLVPSAYGCAETRISLGPYL